MNIHRSITGFTFTLLACAMLTACGDGHDHADHGHADHGHADHDHKDHAHAHTAKYGGALVAIGDHFAHLEFVFDKSTGKLTMHVWDGEVEKPIFLDAPQIEVTVKAPAVTISLEAKESENAGWRVGHSPSFEGQAEQLKGVESFDAVVTEVTIKGQSHKDLAFNSVKGDGKH